MIKFYNKIINSTVEMNGSPSMVIHSLNGCNLKCYKCHNYKELIEKNHDDFYCADDILDIIVSSGYMFDFIIFSGGEFLINNIDDIKSFLFNVRSVYDGEIIINTNGSFPEKIKTLIDLNLVDAFHLDLKISPIEKEWIHLESQVLGINKLEFINKYRRNLKESLSYIMEQNSNYSMIRTVNYPIINQEYLEDIYKDYILIKEEFNSKVKYQLNDFYEINED